MRFVSLSKDLNKNYMADSLPIALVVDDEPDICDLMSMTLRRMDIRTDIAMTVAEAHRRLEEKQYDFCLTDMRLPDGDGLQLVEKIQSYPADRALPVAVFTAHGNMDTAITALKLGAFDFVSKPVNLERLRSLVQLALKLREEHHIPDGELSPLLQGQSLAIQKLRQQITKIARSDAPVHICGEPGSGKEVTARAIHDQSPRAEHLFVPINCSAAPAEQLESMLFGEFDHGVQVSEGLFQLAQGGSLFFDDVTDLPLDMQVKVLRAIQEKSIRPVNGGEEIPIDVRIFSATHKSLIDEVVSGHFRSDLYYRINVIELAVPPLRERSDDIPLLARSIMRDIAANTGNPTPRLTGDALAALQAYSYPGNLRQLENLLERSFALTESSTVRVEDLQLGASHSQVPQECVQAPTPEAGKETPNASDKAQTYPDQFSNSEFSSLDDFLQTIERQAIETALEETRWNRTAAAEKLGISFRSLRYRLKKLGLEND